MTHKDTDNKRSMLMMQVVVKAEIGIDGEYLTIQTKDPVDTYLSLQMKGLLQSGDHLGVTKEKVPKFKEQREFRETRPGHWCDDSYSGPCPRYWVDAEGYYETFQVADGFKTVTNITTSKRGDVRKEDGALFIALDIIDAATLQKKYETALEGSPVSEVLPLIIGNEKSKSLITAFDAVKNIKPLSVEEANDNDAVRKLQGAYTAAVTGMKKAVDSSGLLEILPKENVEALVKRGCGLKKMP